MDQKDIADRNVEQLNFTGDALRRTRSQPGSRPDGGMTTGRDHATINDLRNPQDPNRQSGSTKDLLYQVMNTEAGLRQELASAFKEIEQLEANVLQLENDVIELKSALGSENEQREYAEGVIRKIADLIVNGAKHKNDVAAQ